MCFKCLIILLFIVCLASARATQDESEPNNSLATADGPILFDFELADFLRGGLPGTYGADDSPHFGDYWSFQTTAGLVYKFEASAANPVPLFGMNVDIALLDENGTTISEARTDDKPETIEWTAEQSGTYYLLIFKHDEFPDGSSYYGVSCSVTDPADYAVPTYWGPTLTGVSSVERSDSYDSAQLTWYQATDDISLSENLTYNIYCDSDELKVFDGPPKTSFVGVLQGKVYGLDPDTDYYFGVRAQDEYGNEEKNEVTILSETDPNRPKPTATSYWMLYE